jgi:hypothetical protein
MGGRNVAYRRPLGAILVLCFGFLGFALPPATGSHKEAHMKEVTFSIFSITTSQLIQGILSVVISFLVVRPITKFNKGEELFEAKIIKGNSKKGVFIDLFEDYNTPIILSMYLLIEGIHSFGVVLFAYAIFEVLFDLLKTKKKMESTEIFEHGIMLNGHFYPYKKATKLRYLNGVLTYSNNKKEIDILLYEEQQAIFVENSKKWDQKILLN